MEPAAGPSAAATSPLWWSSLSSAYSQRCHGPRSGRGAGRRKPAPGGARRGGREMPEAVPRLPGRVSGLRGLAGRAETWLLCSREGMGPGQARIQSLLDSFLYRSAPSRYTVLHSLCVSETRSRTRCVAKDEFELAILLPPLSLCWNDRCAPPCLVDTMLGMKPSPSCFISGLTSQRSEAGV